MKLTKIQYKKLDELISMVGNLAKVSNYKFIYAMLYAMRVLPKKYGK